MRTSLLSLHTSCESPACPPVLDRGSFARARTGDRLQLDMLTKRIKVWRAAAMAAATRHRATAAQHAAHAQKEREPRFQTIPGQPRAHAHPVHMYMYTYMYVTLFSLSM